MKGLDTNVLVRLLVADDETQARRVVNLLESAERVGESFFVSSLVLLELAWVLELAYDCTRAEVLEALERLTIPLDAGNWKALTDLADNLGVPVPQSGALRHRDHPDEVNG